MGRAEGCTRPRGGGVGWWPKPHRADPNRQRNQTTASHRRSRIGGIRVLPMSFSAQGLDDRQSRCIWPRARSAERPAGASQETAFRAVETGPEIARVGLSCTVSPAAETVRLALSHGLQKGIRDHLARPRFSGLLGGAERDRTADLRSAIAALSHLSYSPVPRCRPSRLGRAWPVNSVKSRLRRRACRSREGAGRRGHRIRA